MSNLFKKEYNPDVLSCIANLSNDEVFTPPDLVNQMLDMLPEKLWHDPSATFLDPACKSGVFLREIAKRLIDGLKDEIPDLEERLEHIYRKQLFGMAITELTSLLSRRSVYCSKWANGPYSVVQFDDARGNIDYLRLEHTWEGGRCKYCGAAEREYKREEGLEQYAYEFIHLDNPEEVFNMKFDVIIGNPPYQLSDGGFSISATPIYQKFVDQSKSLNPRYLIMIIPARWFAGGKGLNRFRAGMLNDKRMREIHDFPDATDCFPGVQIKGGVCYFLWERDYSGECLVYNHQMDGEAPVSRPLLEDGCETFIRWNKAVSILRKVKSFQESSFEDLVSARRPFGLDTLFHGSVNGDIVLYENGGTSRANRKDILKNHSLIDAWKVYIPRAGSGSDAFPHSILGKPFVGPPGTACTETYIAIGPFASGDECENVVRYVSTKLFRLLVLLKKPSQDATSKVYAFVPRQDFSLTWTDSLLYEKYGISESERLFIDSLIRPMDLGDVSVADGDSDAC